MQCRHCQIWPGCSQRGRNWIDSMNQPINLTSRYSHLGCSQRGRNWIDLMHQPINLTSHYSHFMSFLNVKYQPPCMIAKQTSLIFSSPMSILSCKMPRHSVPNLLDSLGISELPSADPGGLCVVSWLRLGSVMISRMWSFCTGRRNEFWPNICFFFIVFLVCLQYISSWNYRVSKDWVFGKSRLQRRELEWYPFFMGGGHVIDISKRSDVPMCHSRDFGLALKPLSGNKGKIQPTATYWSLFVW